MNKYQEALDSFIFNKRGDILNDAYRNDIGTLQELINKATKKRTTLVEEQKFEDELKWSDSKYANCDMCGDYYHCKYCNKNLTYPCARAVRKYKENEPEEYKKRN